ncbi:class I SAM-dependent methyltransferase [Oceanicella sp. SM1341]|uniref:class I SAM-dependent methyltransferase n=1 Tax=Oceanicella sp. SM1341 TaxID=1548889 RepID=UPI0018E51E07|nr:class I SAM-dependent methyltransferase [Oceanicella sp. SM1341]
MPDDQMTEDHAGLRDARRITCCRSCGGAELTMVLDLGAQPLANALLEPADLDHEEPVFPLEVMICEGCGLLQVSETIPPQVLFGMDYPYYSSFIPALLAHSREHALALMEERRLGADDLVVEIASNDGYLLRNFVEAGVPVLGIDPADGPAAAARKVGVETIQDYFGAALAGQLVSEGRRASVMLANNVLAHVENINDFVEGFAVLLAGDGIAEFEFPYVRDLVEQCAFDTIYHEHVFYYSLTALEPLFERHGLHLNDVTRLPIHGGSLRLRVSRLRGKSARLLALQEEERLLGIGGLDYYQRFGARVEKIGADLRTMLGEMRARGRTVAAYGAAAKGATLLNFARLPEGTIDYVVDRNTNKVGKYMPGVRLEIRPVEALLETKPEALLILSWNFADEIVAQQAAYSSQGGTFLCAIPHPRIIPAPA